MTDRELLGLAAKAVGITVIYNPTKEKFFTVRKRERRFVPFDPLNLDGDAFRLAVDLRMSVQVNDLSVVVYLTQDDIGVTPPPIHEYPGEESDLDHAGCTRRAIVRAAAEIGKAMP